LVIAGLLFIETKLTTDIIAVLLFGAIIVIQLIQKRPLKKGEKI
jgi:hypothetical protein